MSTGKVRFFKAANYFRAVIAVILASTCPALPVKAADGDRAAATSAPAAAGLSSPREAVKNVWSATRAGDVRRLRAALHADSDAERDLVAAMSELLVAGERLRRAARETYGDAGEAMGRRMIEGGDEAALDRAAVKEDGDRAIVTIDGAPRPLTLRRTAGDWRLVVAGPDGGRPVATAEKTALVAASARAIDEAAGEIRAKRHATVEAATAAVEAKLHAVMLDAARGQAAATRPATRPAGS